MAEQPATRETVTEKLVTIEDVEETPSTPTTKESKLIFLKDHKDIKDPFGNFSRKVEEIQLRDSPEDDRWFARFIVSGESEMGLLDSGANPTVTNALDLLEKLAIPIRPYHRPVRTAYGRQHEVLGYAMIPFIFDNREVEIPTLVLPTFPETNSEKETF